MSNYPKALGFLESVVDATLEAWDTYLASTDADALTTFSRQMNRLREYRTESARIADGTGKDA